MFSLMEGSEPFFMPGGPVGCLLIHGFTGTPYEMYGLGVCLSDRGYSVYGPRLTHHGTKAADMNRSRWQDWYNSALDGWHLLRATCEQVFVIGLSMGGMTALMLAAHNPVAGIVTMSTPVTYFHHKWQLQVARIIWPLLPLLKKLPGEDENGSWPTYQQYPVRAAGELLTYLQAVEAALPAVTAPALLLHSGQDSRIPIENLDYIYDHIGSTHKKKVRIEAGGHVMTEGDGKEKVYQEVIDFLEETAA